MCWRSTIVWCATTWSARPSTTDRIRHAAPVGSAHWNVPAVDAVPDRALEEARPAEVEAARGLAQRGPPRGLRPGVQPELERPVLADRGVRIEEPGEDGDRAAGLGEDRLGLGELLARDPLERRREDVVHRLEVVVDEAAGGAHLVGDVADGDGRRGPSGGRR